MDPAWGTCPTPLNLRMYTGWAIYILYDLQWAVVDW